MRRPRTSPDEVLRAVDEVGLRLGRPPTVGELAAEVGAGPVSVRRYLRRLEAEGRVCLQAAGGRRLAVTRRPPGPAPSPLRTGRVHEICTTVGIRPSRMWGLAVGDEPSDAVEEALAALVRLYLSNTFAAWLRARAGGHRPDYGRESEGSQWQTMRTR